MEKPCNGRKNLVAGYSHGWSVIIIRLSVRILQLMCCFIFFPAERRLEKCSFSAFFSGKVHCTNKKPSFHAKGKGWLFSLLVHGEHE